MTSDKISGHRFNALTLQGFNVALSAAVLLLSACGSQHFHVPAEGPPRDAPRFVELEAEGRVATLHFPAGLYSFYAVDDKGYYYRAPRKIIQHTAGASSSRNGGIYLTKRSPKHLRGYVYLAGGLTHVGDLTNQPHQFRD